MVPYFDATYCICMADRPRKQRNILAQLKYFYSDSIPHIFPAINTRHLKNVNHHVGCALSHRAVIQEAKNRGYKNILVFEEDAILHKNFKELLGATTQELHSVPWDVFYLGACVWNPKAPKPPRIFEGVPKCKYLKKLTRSTCTHGLAYNHTCYNYILESWPDTIKEMQNWCKSHAAIDQWLMYKMQGGASLKDGRRKFNCYTTEPRICSQPFLMGTNKQDHPADFLTDDFFG